ncbi:MAG TPA: hypothetical protein VFU02_17050, partial [Polyangiaceae bacterium]|nr:hypothetical protein [Polyangiaceae bacterium]
MKRLIFVAGCGLAPWFAACADDDPNDSGDAGNTGMGGSAGASAGQGGSSGSPASSSGTSTGSGGSSGSPAGSSGTSTGSGGSSGSPASSGGTSTGSGGSDMGGSDVGGAAGASGGEAGSGGDARWAACPTADEFEDQASWPDTLEVTEGAVFCATFDENRTLKEEFAKKALLRIAPGSYRLPAAEQAGLALPVCIALGAEGVGVAAVPRSTSHQANPFDGNVSHRYDFASEQPDPARRVNVSLYLTLPEGQAPGFVLDGDHPALFGPTEPHNTFTLCESLDESCFPDRSFDSCTHASSTLNRHQIGLDSGDITLDVRIGDSYASTEPGAFVAARGTFRGVAFEQENYFKLV